MSAKRPEAALVVIEWTCPECGLSQAGPVSKEEALAGFGENLVCEKPTCNKSLDRLPLKWSGR